MPFLSVNLCLRHPGHFLSPADVIAALRREVAGLRTDLVDQLRLRVDHARELLSTGSDSEAAVLRSMERDANEQGPVYLFSFDLYRHHIEGLVKRQYIQMKVDESADSETLGQLEQILRAVIPLGDDAIIDHT